MADQGNLPIDAGPVPPGDRRAFAVASASAITLARDLQTEGGALKYAP
jgi:hypothetical protein